VISCDLPKGESNIMPTIIEKRWRKTKSREGHAY